MTFVDSQWVVVGIDSSQTSLRAALWAADVAARMQAPLLLAHAVTIPGWYLSEAALLSSTTKAEVEAAGERLVADIKDTIAEKFPNLEINTLARSAPADLMLVALSKHARLLIVGAHRTSVAESLMLGSTAALVARHAHCPTVVWRPGVEKGSVMVGVDGSPLSIAAIEHAFEYSSWFGVRLDAVHAWSDTRLWLADVDDSEKAVLAESIAGWGEKFPEVDVRMISIPGDPRDVLSDSARTAELVVVGSHGRNRPAAFILGSVSDHLIRHSPCPVMVCRRP